MHLGPAILLPGVNMYNTKIKLCDCGSGEYRYDLCDARGIFIAYICSKCEANHMSGFRPEIFIDSHYECDESVDEEF